jgi:hypothetical protein
MNIEKNMKIGIYKLEQRFEHIINHKQVHLSNLK